jgi:hypothetical protein
MTQNGTYITYMCALLQVRNYIFEVAGQDPLQVDIVSVFFEGVVGRMFHVNFSEGHTWLLLPTVHGRQERDAVVSLASQSCAMGARSVGIMLTSVVRASPLFAYCIHYDVITQQLVERR